MTKDEEEEDFDFTENGTVGGHGEGDGNELDMGTVEPETKWNYLRGAEDVGAAQASLQGDFLGNPDIKQDELDEGNSETENLPQEPLKEKGEGDSDFASVELLENNTLQFAEEDGTPQVNSIPGIGMAAVGSTSIPGISTGLPVYGDDGGEVNGDGFVNEGSERQEVTLRAEVGGVQNQDLEEGDEWDSDSEDDLQIVLNDDRALYQNLERGERDFEEGSEDEDGDDLVIVAGGDPPIEEQEWGAETQLPLEGIATTSGDKALPPDKAGDDRGQNVKGNIVIGNGGLPRVGYGSQHYHPHYSQYKYVRPGATAISGGISSASGGAQIRPPVSGGGVWGPGKGVSTTGRGDWIAGGGRGSLQRTSLSGPGMPPWSGVSGGRGFLNGFEFTLPPNKTIFEIEIDSFEEKPWKHPGVDVSDFFNFNLDEDSWKQYCKQLEQLRLEATMQSKIRVYESGRSEQEYDPDLPPELAAAAGLPEAYGENNQNKPSDVGSSVGGRGRGSGRGRLPIPTGRAIQVEGGGGCERRPSVDFRRPRFHDSDAVIEIVLQDASMDDAADSSRAPKGGDDANEKEESEKGDHDFGGDDKQVNPEYFLQSHHTESWERDNDDRKISSVGGLMPRSLHHGDGILPLPPGPPIHCQPGAAVGPAIFSARMLDQYVQDA
uniref:Pre-mRNA polyadenylation factor Fip1 domain-containing protein n=1 Tax=Araucaria cunninghamii TaxID=56994 RepID=A0A0D6R0G6_ARACU